jgi:hypothetical protein
MPEPVNTKAAFRRSLRLDSLDALLAEARALAQADAAGTLHATGNWSLGQTLGHIAGWMNTGFDGYPPGIPPMPWFLKLLLRGFKRKFLEQGLPAGVRIKGLAQGTAFTDPLSTAEGLDRLTRAVARMQAGTPTGPHPVFGSMRPQDWINLNLRHAELHLGFLHPTAPNSR